VIPVITAKLKADGAVKAEKHAVTVAHDFDAVTNRIFTIRIELGGASKNLFENARKLRHWCFPMTSLWPGQPSPRVLRLKMDGTDPWSRRPPKADIAMMLSSRLDG